MPTQEHTFATRFDGITGSAIREIFGVASRPGVISFAGGNPAADALPAAPCAEIARDVLLEDGRRLLQYGATNGYRPFVESLSDYLQQQFSCPIPRESLLPTTGSTQGMDLLCKALLNPGDTVLVESPTFLGNMQSLRLYQAKLVPVASDGQGLLPNQLEEAVKAHHPKLLYTIPTFQNPTGRTLPLDRRQAIAQLAEKYGFLVLEDDPYRELRYEGSSLPPIKAFDKAGQVAYMGSFSKTISPGLRVGYLWASQDLVQKCAIGKQAADLHTPLLTQAIVDQFLRRGLLAPHIAQVLPTYREKLHLMLRQLDAFPQGTCYTQPEGGLFVFITLPKELHATRLFSDAVEQGVAYVPGTYFYPGGEHHNTLRLNFSNSSPEEIVRGMGILAKLFTSSGS